MSGWACYVERVAEISRQDGDFILNQMSYARGLHYQTLYYRKHGVECERPARKVHRRLME